MTAETRFILGKLPIYFDRRRYPKSDYLLIEIAAWGAWLLRIFAPAAWVLACFQMDGPSPWKSVTKARATEIYQLAALVVTCATLMSEAFIQCGFWRGVCAGIAVVFVVECIQYQFWTTVLRPALDPEFKIYNATRSLLLVVVQYAQTMIAFAILYAGVLRDSFNICGLSWHAGLEFSALTMTTVSFGTIVPKAESVAAAVAALQVFTGVFFLGVILTTALSRTRIVGVVTPHDDR